MLTAKNELFESALHVFSTQPSGSEISLAEWNTPEIWIGAYQGLANGAVFFAERWRHPPATAIIPVHVKEKSHLAGSFRPAR